MTIANRADGAEPSASGGRVCPRCGEPTPALHEGYCESCREANQSALDEHIARHRYWEQLTDWQRDDEIRKATA